MLMKEKSTLAQWLAYVESIHEQPMVLGLERMREMIERLGIRFDCPVITVAGTNGKGSTCTFLEAICREAGMHTALHTSPHILRFNERALIDGREASDEALVEAFRTVEEKRAGLKLTYFEFTGLAILLLFMRSRPDVVILEIGLGGRLDAMNAIDSDAAVIATIGLDHTAILGDTREAIGFEKACVYRAGAPAVCADPDVPESVRRHAAEIGADFMAAGRDFEVRRHADGRFDFEWRGADALRLENLPQPGLAGENQYQNLAGALAVLCALRARCPERFPIDRAALARGIASARIRARFERISSDPEIILDVGHNPQAAAVLAENLRASKRPGTHTLAVFGMLKDKDRAGVVSLVRSEIDEWFVAGLPGPRGADLENIKAALLSGGVDPALVHGCPSIAEALADARAHAANACRSRASGSSADRIIVFGSFVTVTEALEAFEAAHREAPKA